MAQPDQGKPSGLAGAEEATNPVITSAVDKLVAWRPPQTCQDPLRWAGNQLQLIGDPDVSIEPDQAVRMAVKREMATTRASSS